MNNEESPHKNVSLLDVLCYCRNSWSKLHFLIMGNTSNHNSPPPINETVTQVFPVLNVHEHLPFSVPRIEKWYETVIKQIQYLQTKCQNVGSSAFAQCVAFIIGIVCITQPRLDLLNLHILSIYLHPLRPTNNTHFFYFGIYA